MSWLEPRWTTKKAIVVSRLELAAEKVVVICTGGLACSGSGGTETDPSIRASLLRPRERAELAIPLLVRASRSIKHQRGEPGPFILRTTTQGDQMGLMWCTGSASCVVFFLVHGEPCAYMGDHHLCVYRF